MAWTGSGEGSGGLEDVEGQGRGGNLGPIVLAISSHGRNSSPKAFSLTAPTSWPPWEAQPAPPTHIQIPNPNLLKHISWHGLLFFVCKLHVWAYASTTTTFQITRRSLSLCWPKYSFRELIWHRHSLAKYILYFIIVILQSIWLKSKNPIAEVQSSHPKIYFANTGDLMCISQMNTVFST